MRLRTRAAGRSAEMCGFVDVGDVGLEACAFLHGCDAHMGLAAPAPRIGYVSWGILKVPTKFEIFAIGACASGDISV